MKISARKSEERRQPQRRGGEPVSGLDAAAQFVSGELAFQDGGGTGFFQRQGSGWKVKVGNIPQPCPFHLPVPILILSLAGTAQLVRIMRANLLDELRRPYVVTARARGLPERRVILKYPVRAAMNPFASTIGYLLPQLVSGSIIISVVLSLPTVGPLLLRSLLSQDMLLACTIILLLGVLTVVGTLLSDLLLMWIDPRIRLGQMR